MSDWAAGDEPEERGGRGPGAERAADAALETDDGAAARAAGTAPGPPDGPPEAHDPDSPDSPDSPHSVSSAGSAREEDDGPRALGVGVRPTGHGPVDAQLRRLQDADHLAVSGHLEVYEDVHRGLRDTLTALDRRPAPTPAAPTPAAPTHRS